MSPSTEPLVSVVIPAYNYGRFISHTLDSVRTQTYESWECIVVDDGSTDDTADVVARYADEDSRVRYVRQNNQGLAAARNKGIQLGGGKYFQFLDADDLLEQKKLEHHADFLECHPEVGIVYGGARYFSTHDPSERRLSLHEEDAAWILEISGAGKDVLQALIKNNFMAVNCALLRREVVEAVGPFDGSVRGVEDWDYWIRCAARGVRFHYADFDGALALVRMHPESMSRDNRLMIRSTLLMQKKLAGTVTDAEVRRFNRERIAEREGLLGVEEFVEGARARGILQFLKASALDRRARVRAKWLICAASAPFVSSRRLKAMVTSSLTGSIKRKRILPT